MNLKQTLTSHRSVSAKVTISDLECLLAKLSDVCKGDDRICCLRVRSLIKSGSSFGGYDLEEIAIFLGDITNTYDIPGSLSVEVHTMRAFIRNKDGRTADAIRSLLHALWIQKTIGSDDVSIALTKHRLGLVYAAIGECGPAVNLLEMALVTYKAANLSTGHACIVNTKECLEALRGDNEQRTTLLFDWTASFALRHKGKKQRSFSPRRAKPESATAA